MVAHSVVGPWNGRNGFIHDNARGEVVSTMGSRARILNKLRWPAATDNEDYPYPGQYIEASPAGSSLIEGGGMCGSICTKVYTSHPPGKMILKYGGMVHRAS